MLTVKEQEVYDFILEYQNDDDETFLRSKDSQNEKTQKKMNAAKLNGICYNI